MLFDYCFLFNNCVVTKIQKKNNRIIEPENISIFIAKNYDRVIKDFQASKCGILG